MKVVAIFLLTCVSHPVLFGQNGRVGINTNLPKAGLHVADSNVVFSAAGLAPAVPGPPPLSGDGRRMMWYPEKAAFMAGYAYMNSWDKDSIGSHSAAFGFGSKAMGEGSFACGEGSVARSIGSTAMGFHAVASGHSATAAGLHSKSTGQNGVALGAFPMASGTSAVAIGHGPVASNYASTALGELTISSGHSSVAMGNRTVASGNFSTATGESTTALGAWSTAMGRGTIAASGGEMVIGLYNTRYTPFSGNEFHPNDQLFTIGNGINDGDAGRSNALVILKNGNTSFGSVNPIAKVEMIHNSVTTSPTLTLYENDIDYARLQFANNGTGRLWQTAAYADGVNHNNSKYNIFYHNGISGTDILSISGNGNATLAGTLTQNSDARLKTGIRPITGALQQLLQVAGYHYYWKNGDRDNSLQTGILAQEVRRVFPELVKESEMGTLSVNYSGLIPYIIESTKTQQRELDDLKQKLINVEAQNTLLMKRLDALETRSGL
ncbi:MAG: tail fiber domain-containing protein [Bacteroidota bacterium]